MGWTDDVDARRRQRAADKAGPAAAAAQTKPPSPPNTLLTLLVAGAVLVPLMHSLGWLEKAEAALEARGVRLPWRRGGSSGSAGSAFRFPKAQQPPPASPAKRALNAKKDKAGRADKRDARAQKRSEAYLQAERDKAERGPKTGKPAGIPEDKDVLGGTEGTTFRTTSHYATSTAQLRAGQEAASSKSLLR